MSEGTSDLQSVLPAEGISLRLYVGDAGPHRVALENRAGKLVLPECVVCGLEFHFKGSGIRLSCSLLDYAEEGNDLVESSLVAGPYLESDYGFLFLKDLHPLAGGDNFEVIRKCY